LLNSPIIFIPFGFWFDELTFANQRVTNRTVLPLKIIFCTYTDS
jgi:hypothetical protein